MSRGRDDRHPSSVDAIDGGRSRRRPPRSVPRGSAHDRSRFRWRALSDESPSRSRDALADAYGVDAQTRSTSSSSARAGVPTSARRPSRRSSSSSSSSRSFMAVYFRTWRMARGGAHRAPPRPGLHRRRLRACRVRGHARDRHRLPDDPGVTRCTTPSSSSTRFGRTPRTTARRSAHLREAANLAVNQTLVRSINTSIVALLPVASILFIGAVRARGGHAQGHLARALRRARGRYLLVDLRRDAASRLGARAATQAAKVSDARRRTSCALARASAGRRCPSTPEAPPIGRRSRTPAMAIAPGGRKGVQAQPRRKRQVVSVRTDARTGGGGAVTDTRAPSTSSRPAGADSSRRQKPPTGSELDGVLEAFRRMYPKAKTTVLERAYEVAAASARGSDAAERRPVHHPPRRRGADHRRARAARHRHRRRAPARRRRGHRLHGRPDCAPSSATRSP